MSSKFRYKLVRICNGRYLSANQNDKKPNEPYCLEYKVGGITSTGGKGVACYKTKKQALNPSHITETRGFWNSGKPIAILKLAPMGEYIPGVSRFYGRDSSYAGGINYRSVKVLEAVNL